MRRREFIAGIGSAALWPLAARAQQPAMPVMGYLSTGRGDPSNQTLVAFHQGLGQAGYVEGRNVAIEYRFAAYGQYDRLPAMAADLVRNQVAMICAAPTIAALAAKAATTTIPIVFSIGADPVTVGLVAALNRPGGNLTGVARLIGGLGPKQMSLLHQVAPNAGTMGYLVNPNNPNSGLETRNMQVAAEALKLKLLVVTAGRNSDFETAFETLVHQRAGALVVAADAYLASEPDRIAALTARHAIPATYPFRLFATAGGLMTYGSDVINAQRQFGIYAGRILKGAKPADLPVVQPTKFEFVINAKTAKALGIQVPETLLATADEVIE
jgi:putative tryptophan/tyrosine transport system substrate-binding protein